MRSDHDLTYSQILEEEPGRIKSRSPFRFGKLDLLSRFNCSDLHGRIFVRAGKRRPLKVDDKIVLGSRVCVQDLPPC